MKNLSLSRILLIIVLLFPVGISAKTIVVSPIGTGDYATIQEAINAAKSGDTVEITASKYEEDIVLKSNMNLIGAGPESTMIIGGQSAILARNVDSCKVSGLTIRTASLEMPPLLCADSTILLENCYIMHSQVSGIEIQGNSSGTFTDLIVYSNRGSGFLIANTASPKIMNCKVYSNGLNGIEVTTNAYPDVKGCEIYNNRQSGILIRQKARPDIERNRIYKNRKPGIACNEEASPTIRGNQIIENNGGLYIAGKSTPKIIENLVKNNYHVAVQVINSMPTIHFNIITESKDAALIIEEGSKAIVSENTIYNNDFVGVLLRENSQAKITKNTVYGNRNEGIWLKEGCEAEITYNIITGQESTNFGDGIHAWENCEITLAYNNIWNNAHKDYRGTRPGDTDISEDPVFTDPDKGDFTLASGSPCLNVGPDNINIGAPRLMSEDYKLAEYNFMEGKPEPEEMRQESNQPEKRILYHSNKPPVISIINPKAEFVQSKNIFLNFLIMDDGKIESVLITHNGKKEWDTAFNKEKKVKKDGYSDLKLNPDTKAIHKARFINKLKLKKGMNKIVITANDGENQAIQEIQIEFKPS